MLNFIKKIKIFFDKIKHQKEKELDISLPKINLELNVNYDPSKKTILMLDDNRLSNILIEDIFKKLEEETNFKRDNFNIIFVDGIYSAFKIKKLLEKNKDFKVDYAILDIFLGGVLYVEGSENKYYDGIDICIDLKKRNPNMKSIFITGNILNEKIDEIKEILEKYKKNTGEDLRNNVIYKRRTSFSEKYKRIKEFLKDEL